MDGRKQRQPSGFTLIEVTFAVLILSGSLAVLLGLQSSVLQRAVRDTRTQEALLTARKILAFIESSRNPVTVQTYDGTPEQILDDLGVPALESELRNRRNNDLRAHLAIEYWGIPEINERAMKRVALEVNWSDSPLDRVEILYFIPNDEVEEQPQQ